MPDQAQMRADRALDGALASAGLEDPRPECRARLKRLRAADAEAFAAASRHYEEVLLPRLASGESDPVAEWIEYGRALAERLEGPGAVYQIDATGRAAPYAGDPAGHVVLHLPERGAASVLSRPAEPAAPQAATIKLLVEGRREI